MLSGHQLGIDSASGQQLTVRPALGQLAVLEHDDAMRAGHARQAVSDDERGAPALEPFERVVDEHLVLGVDAARRLVEHQDGRILEDGAGDGQPLPLPAGQAQAAFADQGVVAPGQGGDEVVGVGRAGGGLELRLAGVGLPEP